MNGRCPDPLDLDLVLLLPDSDPIRRHIDECHRCRGTLEAMELFLDPCDVDHIEGLVSANRELAGRLERVLPAHRRQQPRMRRLGVALAAALALVAVGLTTSEIVRTGRMETVDPGQNQRGPILPEAITLSADESGTRLAWPAAPTADQIVYLFFSAEMDELGRRTAPGALVIGIDDPLSSAAFCQALAVAQGDVIARSAIRRLSPEPE